MPKKKTTTTPQFTGGTAPESLTNFLFRDDHTGKETNEAGLTTRQDIFENWGKKLDELLE